MPVIIVAWLLPELVGSLFSKLVEFNLLGKYVQGYIHGTAQPTSALVVIEYGVERRPVSIKEILVPETNEEP